jgi:hypothetical protein
MAKGERRLAYRAWETASPFPTLNFSFMHKLNTCGLLDSGGGMNPFTSAILRSVIESGYFFWLRLPNTDTQKLQQRAQTHRVGLRDHIRLSISFYEVDEIEDCIARLKKCIEGK